MITHLDVGMAEWWALTIPERNQLGEWIHEVVGTRMFVYGVELVAEGAVRVEIYVDVEGNPVTETNDFHVDRATGDVAMKWFDYPAAVPPPVWPMVPSSRT